MKARVVAIILMAIAASFAYGDESMPKNDTHRVRFRFADGEITVALGTIVSGAEFLGERDGADAVLVEVIE